MTHESKLLGKIIGSQEMNPTLAVGRPENDGQKLVIRSHLDHTLCATRLRAGSFIDHSAN
jgi:hypothetical protein